MHVSDRGLNALIGALTRHWRRILFAGAVNIALGLAALIWPGVTVLALAVLLGALLLISGATLLGTGVAVRSMSLGLLGGIALLAAVICLAHPGAGVFAILLGCAVWFFVTGMAELAAALMGVTGRLWWGVLGGLSIVAAVVMISSPGVAIATVALIAGIAFLLHGTGEVALAWRMRSVHRVVTGP